MVITPRLQALMDAKKATTTTTPKTTAPASTTSSSSSGTPLIQAGTVSQTYVNTPNGYVPQTSASSSSTPKVTTPTTTPAPSSSSGLLGKDLIQQANTQGLTGSARRDYIEAGRSVASAPATVASAPKASTIQSGISTKPSSSSTIQSTLSPSKVATTPYKAPVATSINAPLSAKTVLSSSTTLTPSSPEAKKTGKQLIAETAKLGLTGQARRDYIMKGREDKPITEESTILKQQNSLLEDQKKEDERIKDTEKERVNLDESTLLATKAKNKETLDKYFADTEEQENRYFSDYEAEQNKLFSE